MITPETKQYTAAWQTPASLFAIIMGIYLFFSPAHSLTAPDEELNLRTTLSLLQGQRGAIPPLGGFASKKGIDGREYAQYGLGVPVASALWCKIGLLIDPSENQALNDLSAIHKTNIQETIHAGTSFLRWWMTLWGMIISTLTVIFCFQIWIHLGISKNKSILFSLALAFGTILWPHGHTFFSEPLVAFCLTLTLWCFLKAQTGKEPYRWLLFAAIAWAYSIFTRIDSLVTLPAMIWFFFLKYENKEFHLNYTPKRLLFAAIPFITVLCIILLYNQYRFDSLFSTGYEDQAEKINFLTPVLVGLHGFFFTPGRSLFFYSPPLIFAVFGIRYLWKRNPHFCIGTGLICLGYLGAMSKWQNWAGGYDWGPRHIYQITPLLMLFAGAYINELNLWKTGFHKLATIFFILFSIFMQFLGLTADVVQVTRSWLIQPNTALTGLPEMVKMQFMIYLPQFSTPVLQAEWLCHHTLDLLIIWLTKISFITLLLYVIPVAMVLTGFLGLKKQTNKDTE